MADKEGITRVAGIPQADESVEVVEFSTGARRGTDTDHCRYDLISPLALKALAETCAEGSVKYGDANWLQGLPDSNLLNHVQNHLNSWQSGDTSEPHLAHAMWNLMALIHQEKNRETPGKLHDIPGRYKSVEEYRKYFPEKFEKPQNKTGV